MEAKKKIDESDKSTEERLRRAYEGLYAERYLEIIEQRRAPLLEQQQAGAKHEELPMETEDVKEVVEDNSVTDGPPVDQISKVAKISHPKKRIIIPDRLKRPSDTLKLCENCLLPRHNLTQCPFPLELTKQKSEPTEVSGLRPGPKPKSASDAPKTDDRNSTIPLVMTVELSDVEPPSHPDNSGEHSTGTPSVETKPSTTTRMTKPKTRSVCSLCLHPTKIHSRKHCDRLSEVDHQEYSERREKVLKFIELLELEKEREPVKAPARLVEIWSEPEFNVMTLTDKFLDLVRRQLTYGVERAVEKLLKTAGLGSCVPPDLAKEFPKPVVVQRTLPPVKDAKHPEKGTQQITTFLPSSSDQRPTTKTISESEDETVTNRRSDEKRKKRKPHDDPSKTSEQPTKRSRLMTNAVEPLSLESVLSGGRVSGNSRVYTNPSNAVLTHTHLGQPSHARLSHSSHQTGYGVQVPLPGQSNHQPSEDVVMAALMVLAQRHQQQSSPSFGRQPSPNLGRQPSPNLGHQQSPNLGHKPSPNLGHRPSPNLGHQPSPNLRYDFPSPSQGIGTSGPPPSSPLFLGTPALTDLSNGRSNRNDELIDIDSDSQTNSK